MPNVQQGSWKPVCLVLCKQTIIECNATKTKFTVFRLPSMRCNLTGFNISIGQTRLIRIGEGQGESSTKFLGLYFDEFLNWRSHVNHVNMKISKSLYIMKQAKKYPQHRKHENSVLFPCPPIYIIWTVSLGVRISNCFASNLYSSEESNQNCLQSILQ